VHILEGGVCVHGIYNFEGILQDGSEIDKGHFGLPTPKCIFYLINFHGLASLYREFIQNSNEIFAPLTHCMEKGNFQWTIGSMKSFNNLKMKVIR